MTGLRNLVCKALFSTVSSRPKDPKINSAYDVVLYWASQSVDIHSTVSLKALDFIKEIYEVRMRFHLFNVNQITGSTCTLKTGMEFIVFM